MNFETYKITQGNIMIAFSDKNLSVGILTINSKQELSKHNRPVLESLYQIKGKCVIKLFDKNNNVKEVILNERESIDIPPKQYHIHSNPYDKTSITFWKASGDITKIIGDIKKSEHM